MTFQASLDAIEERTGLTPREVLALARARGYDERTPTERVLAWLAADFTLAPGDAMALVHVLRHGAGPDPVVGPDGTPADLWLDGRATRPR